MVNYKVVPVILIEGDYGHDFVYVRIGDETCNLFVHKLTKCGKRYQRSVTGW
ncbi:hypothetical protein FC50_GL001119 [Lacticaseibacillus pantheris DSM 15945 = JCM 12539 = NBRC 106106]|uniref:Uncharacterized protein n=1 Tax=Lacticaseibacillus pantheris DSM 15945 = JCM 12539 = NBRC 106106 TaxID=1423783 RepID=A0A0R1U386_9LACO|nr:hypothetical protein FC50_GL001119 [Lacticaseibacillus pantheris DSM 15945 = JCM 12539 = NBRC 106106]